MQRTSDSTFEAGSIEKDAGIVHQSCHCRRIALIIWVPGAHVTLLESLGVELHVLRLDAFGMPFQILHVGVVGEVCAVATASLLQIR